MRKPLRAKLAPATLMPANNALAGMTGNPTAIRAIAKTLREYRRTVSALAAFSPTTSHCFPATVCARP
ncbi:hypothetical protein EB810_10990 [Altererythrobacter sp. FM1]|uniref:hypothetical protein n=1 Tax=Tsuneonella flava TaxID=2055955 RepID=UPI000C80A238|nr:hypothetical protein [Tsuneonella flava]ROT95581.1 hypothetical protein EB810_10990 [Altererythrobacter sp. FM1]